MAVNVRLLVLLALLGMTLEGCIKFGSDSAEQSEAPAAEAPAPLKKVERKVPVVFARSTIAKSRTIQRVWLEIREVPEKEAPAEPYVSAIEEAVDKITSIDIPQGTPLLKGIIHENRVTRLSHLVSPGMRAVTIKSSAILAMPFLRQGDTVDIIGTFSVDLPKAGRGSARKENMTRIIMRGVKVLAVDTKFSPGRAALADEEAQQTAAGKKAAKIDSPYVGRATIRAVTLEVSPADAGLLAFADDTTKLHLATCSEGGNDPDAPDVSITDRSVRGDEEKVDETAKGPAKLTIIKGLRLQEMFLPTVDKDTYDEDADAPLFQDGRSTGVRPRRSDGPSAAEEERPIGEIPIHLDDGELPNLPSLPSLDE